MIIGRKRLHFSNNKGYINNAVFEGITTAEDYCDRLLGKNDLLSFPNELDFSLSGNVGVTYTPDFANRCKFINLFLEDEDANARIFENPNLHNWVLENRSLILSALYSLVKNWIDNGSKPGSIPFSSFPEWARVCGGVMEAAGYDNPCKPDKDNLGVGDSETEEMKSLFELCFKNHPEEWIKQENIKSVILNEGDGLFIDYDFDLKSSQAKFGLQLSKYVGRIFSEIKLIIYSKTARGARKQFKFTKKEEKGEKQSIFGENNGEDVKVEKVVTPINLKNIQKSHNNIGVVDTFTTLPTFTSVEKDPKDMTEEELMERVVIDYVPIKLREVK